MYVWLVTGWASLSDWNDIAIVKNYIYLLIDWFSDRKKMADSSSDSVSIDMGTLSPSGKVPTLLCFCFNSRSILINEDGIFVFIVVEVRFCLCLIFECGNGYWFLNFLLYMQEHVIRTFRGCVSVTVYGDQDKPALITYPDIALNCKFIQIQLYWDELMVYLLCIERLYVGIQDMNCWFI